ncbi:uncharacterized protein BDW43DRAFT_284100, partial [Aspergillus alliaceus]|uniref:uncharacterized protein n=1 Tax=Petromyces alliaceus TaxID=209559 RepID=UPI0012A435B4
MQPAEKQEAFIMGYHVSKAISRLDALLLVLKTCQGASCIKPWDILHPSGSVETLRDAMAEEYDQFYHEHNKVSYDRCEYYDVLDEEGPREVLAYRNGI